MEIWEWPLPAFDLAGFEEALLRDDFPVFAATRPAYLECRRLRALRTAAPPEYDRALPLFASTLSGAIHDALWSVYFASGEPACLFRLLDMAACSLARYTALLDPQRAAPDGGLAQALQLMQSSGGGTDVRAVVKLLPAKDHASILYVMSGLSACWSLLENARAQPRIRTVLTRTLQTLEQRAQGGGLGAEEARVLNVLQLLTSQLGEPQGKAE